MSEPIDADPETFRWDEPYPFDLLEVDPDADDDWKALFLEYARSSDPWPPSGSDRSFFRCLEVVRANRAQTILVETRYIDSDYRSEYAALYAGAFEHFEDSTRRLHFFSTAISEDEVWRLSEPQTESYLGYIVIRPQLRGIVGRTMLRPPLLMREAVRTAVSENVHLFGQKLTVRAVPFVQQDARLGSCAHAAAWMCHYSAYRGDRGVSRKTIAEFSGAVNPGLGVGRTLPSTGLTLHQMSDVLTGFGLAPVHYEVVKLGDDDRPDEWHGRHTGVPGALARTCCRYLNSGLPLLIVLRQHGAGLHAIACCGYERSDDYPAGVRFIANDDRRGPYLWVTDPLNDLDPVTNATYTWEQILAPVPRKLWLSGEAAERKGCSQILNAARAVATANKDRPSEQQVQRPDLILALFEEDELSVRTYASDSSRFKERMRKATTDPAVLREISLVRLPRYVWVVEMIDRRRRREPNLCVLGAIVMDATSDDLDPRVLITYLPGILAIPKPYDPLWDTACGVGYVDTGGQYAP